MTTVSARPTIHVCRSRLQSRLLAFPPILSPCEIDLDDYGLKLESADGTEDLAQEPYTTKVVLTDGGVYDNLGLETIWKRYTTLLVSDGGGHYKPEPKPHHDWARHAIRVLDVIDSQVRALRSRQLMTLFNEEHRTGAYWGIRQDVRKYGETPDLPCPLKNTTELAATPTRLQKMDSRLQERLSTGDMRSAMQRYGSTWRCHNRRLGSRIRLWVSDTASA